MKRHSITAFALFFALMVTPSASHATGAEAVLGVRVKLISQIEMGAQIAAIPAPEESLDSRMHNKLMGRLDKSANGTVSSTEFRQACIGNTDTLFAALDLDKNTAIDQDEIEFYAITKQTVGC